jgi:hypothetical protein
VFKTVSALIFFVSLAVSVPSSAATRWFQPVIQLPTPAIRTFQCILKAESRSTFTHPNLGDNNRYGSSGIFQIEQATWQEWATPLGIHVPVWQATPLQQATVAVNIYKHDGFGPWRSDGCV